jgi:hypothetical protein
LPRPLSQSRLAVIAAVALAAGAAGCSGVGDINLLENKDQAFTKPLFQAPDWARVSYTTKTAPLGPSGPVAPEDLVDAGGHCAAEARAQAPAEPAPAPAAPAAAEPATAPTAPPAKPSYGSLAGDLASAPMPQGPPPAPMPVSVPANERMDTLQPEGGGGPPVLGGIALGMTECQAVRRAGQPSNVAISAGDKGARKVVITYLTGTWPGIYTFDSGRLQEIDEVPEQQKPAKPAPKKKPKKKAAKTAKTATTEHMYVQ